LPGHLLLIAFTGGERAGLARSVALGLPLGFAFEVLLYLSCAAVGMRGGFPAIALLGVLLLGAWVWRRNGGRSLLPAIPRVATGVWLAMSGLLLLLMITTAARLYAPAPLDAGRLMHSTHHDWVYLVSRAAEIRHHWPFEDPSLAGTPLSYHYFLLVHVASASQVTGLEISKVLLRMVSVPMGVVLLTQVFLLGCIVGRSNRAGLLAAALMLAVGEVTLTGAAGGGGASKGFS